MSKQNKDVTTGKNDVKTKRLARAGRKDKVEERPQPSNKKKNQSSRRFKYKYTG
jgi:hypothetical protein